MDEAETIEKLIFISHAGNDKKLVDEFVNLLDTGIKVDRDVIYQSSRRSLGTAAGKDFRETIGRHIKSSKIVIILLSSNYLNSQYCLGEMGAAWILGTRIFVFLVGDVSYSEIEGFLKPLDMGSITDKLRLTELYKAVRTTLNLNDDPPNWENERDLFLEKAAAIIPNLPMSVPVPRADYDHEIQRRKDMQGKLQTVQRELDDQKRLNARIIDEKIAAEQAQLIALEGMPEIKQFVKLCDGLKEAIKGFSDAIISAIYKHLKGEELRYKKASYVGDNEFNADIDAAIDRKYLIGGDVGSNEHFINAKPNLMNKSIINAVECARELESWLIQCSEQILVALEAEYKFQPDISNFDFWETIQAGKHNTLQIGN